MDTKGEAIMNSEGEAINYVEYDIKTGACFIRLVGTSPKYTIQQRIDFMTAAEGMYEALKGILLVAIPSSPESHYEFEKHYTGGFKVFGNRLNKAVEALAKAK